MSTLAGELGHHLWNHGFRPLPDVADDGRLLGVRLWRPHNGYVEFIAPRSSGATTAGRVVADFSFRNPFRHGPVVNVRRGGALDSLYWLLSEDGSC